MVRGLLQARTVRKVAVPLRLLLAIARGLLRGISKIAMLRSSQTLLHLGPLRFFRGDLVLLLLLLLLLLF
jgi:hypothetical protein